MKVEKWNEIAALIRLGQGLQKLEREKAIGFSLFPATRWLSWAQAFHFYCWSSTSSVLHLKEKKNADETQKSPSASRNVVLRAQLCCPSPPARTPLPRLHGMLALDTQEFLLNLRRGPQFGSSHPAKGKVQWVPADSLESC